jgi:tetraacyldisaccharide 4'-kinase
VKLTASKLPLLLLFPLGWLHRRGAALRNAMYDIGFLAVRGAGLPVVSIGNLSFGGAGKTPAAIWLTGLLTERGFRVAVVSRGYLGRRGHDPLVVSRQGRLLASHREGGDEAVLLALESRAHVVVVGRDRVQAAALAKDEGADLVVLDDGFQHRRLQREVDIVIVDVNTTFAGRPQCAAEFLREPLAGLRRANLILLTDSAGAKPASGFLTPAEMPPALASLLRRRLSSRAPEVAFVASRATALTLPGGERAAPGALAGRVVLAVSGIARPAAFRRTIESLGALVAAELAFPDHHAYGPADAANIARLARTAGAEHIVTTSKDLVRWPAHAPAPTVVHTEFTSPAEQAIIQLILGRVLVARPVGAV